MQQRENEMHCVAYGVLARRHLIRVPECTVSMQQSI